MMRGEQQIRTLMGPADPARAVPVPPPAVPAERLIAAAEAATPTPPIHRRWVVARRPVLATAAAVAAAVAVAAYPVAEPEPEHRPDPSLADGVVVPMAYEIQDDPPPAAAHLRELATNIVDAPYDGRTGDYAYHRIRTWGAAHYVGSPCDSDEPELADCPVVSEVIENESWVSADLRRHRSGAVGVEYPNESSRRYFEAHPDQLPLGGPRFIVDEAAGVPPAPLPTDRARLAELIGLDDGVPDFWRIDVELYASHLVPRRVRAAVLELLADVPGIEWRGRVTDRAGRTGVAITYDSTRFGMELQDVLVFDPETGELLARESLEPRPAMPLVDYYTLFLQTGWTDDPGPAPSTQPAPSPTA